MPVPDYVILNQAVDDICKATNIQNTQVFLEKVQQLYEMIIVRHGLMIVGLPFGGKTSCYRVLADSLGLAEERVSSFLQAYITGMNEIFPRVVWTNTGLYTP